MLVDIYDSQVSETRENGKSAVLQQTLDRSETMFYVKCRFAVWMLCNTYFEAISPYG